MPPAGETETNVRATPARHEIALAFGLAHKRPRWCPEPATARGRVPAPTAAARWVAECPKMAERGPVERAPCALSLLLPEMPQRETIFGHCHGPVKCINLGSSGGPSPTLISLPCINVPRLEYTEFRSLADGVAQGSSWAKASSNAPLKSAVPGGR